jgi:hypothetical protein
MHRAINELSTVLVRAAKVVVRKVANACAARPEQAVGRTRHVDERHSS